MRFIEDFVLSLEAWRSYPTPQRERTSPWIACDDGIERRFVLARVERARSPLSSQTTQPLRARPPVFR